LGCDPTVSTILSANSRPQRQWRAFAVALREPQDKPLKEKEEQTKFLPAFFMIPAMTAAAAAQPAAYHCCPQGYGHSRGGAEPWETEKLRRGYGVAGTCMPGLPHETAVCRDYSYSYSRHPQRTCSSHGGVREWCE
jgi:hypothetical protein